jgi:hypothetical protein
VGRTRKERKSLELANGCGGRCEWLRLWVDASETVCVGGVVRSDVQLC